MNVMELIFDNLHELEYHFPRRFINTSTVEIHDIIVCNGSEKGSFSIKILHRIVVGKLENFDLYNTEECQ